MSPRVLLLLLGICMLQASVEGPQVKSEKGVSGNSDGSHSPKSQEPETKPITEGTKPPATGRRATSISKATHILNTILSNYDYRLRPGIGGKPTVVTVEFSVNNIGPVSIVDMEYTIDIIFYQTWYDERLCYNDSTDSIKTLVLQSNMVSQLWIPDTFFWKSKRTQEHSITMPNQMVRIHKDGKVLYTIRMTIDAGCTFNMQRFPMDSHSCPLSFSSFSYPTSEVIYKWADFQLVMNEDNSWKLFQFDFKGMSNKTEMLSTPAGDFVVLTSFFNISRRFGYVAIQHYVPSSVTTMLSWVSFWIKKDAASARTSLGVTSVLTMTTLSTFSRKNFPRVSYITALDCYITTCFVFCFCALTEFAMLNFLTYTQMKAHPSPKLSQYRRRGRGRAEASVPARLRARQLPETFVCTVVNMGDSDGDDDDEQEDQPADVGSAPPPQFLCSMWRQGFKKYFCVIANCEGSTWQQGHLCIHIDRLDDYSRVVFPLAFFFFNVLYWLVCIYS
ncbi:gamma-aminobutyric acid receptor subunit epsilon [Echinops telfairi]|uniref:Gamma-aminobutyric acid receptor subunit epsilon n=1 Tax=Echinops telfairi TaxID=9371 RepID=A0ABM0J643_ECHTE|nr:gamma-aminobutyric acid receptor subunit epsilon [Echinops telfairi]